MNDVCGVGRALIFQWMSASLLYAIIPGQKGVSHLPSRFPPPWPFPTSLAKSLDNSPLHFLAASELKA